MSDSGRADALLADLPRDGRGRLKVFLGAAPGVGKTYAMLQAAHTQLRQGVKVLAGVVETHGRAETEALLAGLPQQPLVRSEYRGVMLEEMDLDGLLAAKPKLVLVDELAHTNAPGSRHTKRWQDIQELLAAGIDVFTTVNVQHLESLNDQVRGITGVQVRETLPDWVLQEAYELLLIDLPPRELLERLRDGKVYVPEQARAAIDAFFTQTNLTALRELAMQTAAAQVDNDLAQGYRQLGQAAPAVRGRLLVGVDGDAQAERLVRHASRVAQRRHLPWSLVHVDNGRVRDEQSRLRLQSAQQLAERLGGEVVLLRAGEVAKTLIQHAAERRASLVLVGQSRQRLRRRLFGGGLASRLLRDARGLEINVLDSDHEQHQPRQRSVQSLVWFDYALALVATVLASALAWAVSSVLPLPNISLVFLAAVLLVAVRSSLGPALACAALSFLTYDFLFIPPKFSFAIQREEDVLTLLFFLLMAALTGNLAARQRRQLEALRDTQEETSELLDLSRKLTAATDRQAVVSAAAQHLNGWSDLKLCLLNRDGQSGWKVETGGPLEFSEAERAAADWAWQHDQPAGAGTGTLPFGRWWWWPLSVDDGPLALLGVCAKEGQTLSGQRRRLLTALSQPLAQALARAQLADDLEAARLHGETEQLRSALLASVSHDLRTPLTSMRGSIDSLLALGEAIPLADRRELLEGTRDEAERLDRYIQNLLDMTRLGHGALKLARDWVSPADIVGSALNRLRAVLASLHVVTEVPAELPLLYVHAALIEQALVNVLENAARFSPPHGRLELRAGATDSELFFSVSDEGPGIPEEERAKVFDMFYTAARGDRGGQGTGLGLAICQGMVGAHGGRISVADGIEGRGTCITLHLPLQTQPGLDSEA
ncbi:two-component system sensor histidine kinase KdpD [Pseudomonas sp. PvR086]|jgi:two-component system sensor histidine kinase KdpD|uniref:sensor histidine kinase n=1 Tax=Pseudomonas TaxID=286 RepID=UPI0007DDA97D|nr:MULTISPECIES: sensor histidine kinase KdpD [Pseudomonas]ANI59167.1 histidine kinase [Pseudomonas sp. GR 6-02]MBD9606418.1 sensor histidine kinase KdpD [Pseudomonas sp. PDM08]MDR7108152.1 two-component system sensor histidine kinase KdpD [Pseudomonas frederiksbergensis]PMY52473.1 sensor histidine kinase KdpD [Pseudomonas sp. FW305-53]PMY86118.1 sensor histidine kinase KdpD [Pseudomonas sp. FW303-C2]